MATLNVCVVEEVPEFIADSINCDNKGYFIIGIALLLDDTKLKGRISDASN